MHPISAFIDLFNVLLLWLLYLFLQLTVPYILNYQFTSDDKSLLKPFAA